MSRAITITGFCLIIAACMALEMRARTSESRLASSNDLLRRVMGARGGRTVVFVVWFWLGWHFLAR